MAHNYESHFGPSSELIDIAQFIQNESNGLLNPYVPSASDIECYQQLQQQPDDQRNLIQDECSVVDIQESILQVWTNPGLYAHFTRSHDATVCGIHDSVDSSNKKRRKRTTLNDPAKEFPEAAELEKRFEAIQLKSWPLMLDSAIFMRTPRNSDYNALSEVKHTASPRSLVTSSNSKVAIVIVTIHNPLSWAHGQVSRGSQHAFLSSQTLGDLFKAIPCNSSDYPQPVKHLGRVFGYQNSVKPQNGNGAGPCVMVVENIAYGDGETEEDYADKLLAQLERIPPEKRLTIKKGLTALDGTTFSSLSLKLNEPYWLLHQGSCEHYVVFDHIRLQHPSDIISNYPLTLQITPAMLSLCRACSKVPAVLSVVGDIRLGESPCLLCAPCWRHMGRPGDQEDVLVVPLPSHEVGW